MSAERKASISRGRTPEEIGEFWGTHDLADYIDQTIDVTQGFESEMQSLRHLVALDPRLLPEAIRSAHRQGITVATLVNLAVKEALGRSPRR